MKKNIILKLSTFLVLFILLISFAPSLMADEFDFDFGDEEAGEEFDFEAGEDFGDEAGEDFDFGEEAGEDFDFGEDAGEDTEDIEDLGDEDFDFDLGDVGDEFDFDFDEDDMDIPAKWRNLHSVAIPRGSLDNTIIYQNIYNYCVDEDDLELITVDSNHQSYNLEINSNNDLVIKDLDHTYMGTEIVTLECNGIPGRFALIVKSFIAPTANFNYQPDEPEVNELVQFQDISTDSDGHIVQRSWNFGDSSTTSNEINPFHTYDQKGRYDVTLTVWDNDGASSTLTRIVTVGEQGDPSSFASANERTIFSRIRYNDYANAGDIVAINIGIFNDGTYDMEDMEVSVHILDLEERRTAGPFDVKDGQEETANLFLEIPFDAQPGSYDIRIIASNDDFSRTEHRVITIN